METSIVYAIYIVAFAAGLAALVCACLFFLWFATAFLWWKTKPVHRVEFAKWHWRHCGYGARGYIGQGGDVKDEELQ